MRACFSLIMNAHAVFSCLLRKCSHNECTVVLFHLFLN